MAEMKNPNQQMGGESVRSMIAMVLIVAMVLFLQQLVKRAVDLKAKVGQAAVLGQTNVPQGIAVATVQDPAAHVGLPAAHVGFPDRLARPFLVVLRWIQGHVVSNWGWAILLLTLLINLGLLPVRMKAMRSQLAMQRMQPEMAAIKERFKGCKLGDARMQTMHQEIGALQRAHGISMFSNMLPLLIQWPLLYGVYRMLHGAAELHHAPWLWLHDLSAADPLHILPMFFLATMILQQMVTPAPGTDAAQRRIMAIVLPPIYAWMTWHVSAGLALYWSCGNLIAIVQQLVFNRTKSAVETRDLMDRRRLALPSVGG